MIESLDIDNLGVIESAHVDFGPRFTVLTGETGAGKTMVLTSRALHGRASMAFFQFLHRSLKKLTRWAGLLMTVFCMSLVPFH